MKLLPINNNCNNSNQIFKARLNCSMLDKIRWQKIEQGFINKTKDVPDNITMIVLEAPRNELLIARNDSTKHGTGYYLALDSKAKEHFLKLENNQIVDTLVKVMKALDYNSIYNRLKRELENSKKINLYYSKGKTSGDLFHDETHNSMHKQIAWDEALLCGNVELCKDGKNVPFTQN